jgi:hypothetical protein
MSTVFIFIHNQLFKMLIYFPYYQCQLIPNVRIFQYWFTESFLEWKSTKNYIQTNYILGLINIKKLNLILLNNLTYRYNYDRKFEKAKYDEKGNPTNKSAELRQKFEGHTKPKMLLMVWELKIK